ncbi:hypothetical protein [Chamaesiphon minutus]|uniref:hypothetical protein n=1 Tax=Chamaesiphon minutus TaxID=1173032 RepID=UPI0002FFD29A|nr:hypothetical protein [Chamaesiphon minutus]
MSLSKGVEIHTLTSAKAGLIQFYTPQASHETTASAPQTLLTKGLLLRASI